MTVPKESCQSFTLLRMQYLATIYRLEINPSSHVGDADNSGQTIGSERRLLRLGHWRMSQSRRGYCPQWGIVQNRALDADI